MTTKAKIQEIIADWKKQESETDKELFLAKIKSDIDAKNGEELMEGVKALGELAHDLHEEVMQSAPVTKAIKVFPNDAKEARLIEELLSRMRVRYKVG